MSSVRAAYLAAFGLLAVAYYVFLGPGPSLSDAAGQPWWAPTGGWLRAGALAGLRDLAKEAGAVRFIPSLLFALPPIALAWLAFRLFQSAVLRTAAVCLALTCASFAVYGYLAEGIWRFFSWRWAAVWLSMAAITAVVAMAPSLLRSALRLHTGIRAALLLAGSLAVYLASIEITGTDPSLQANLSPWPVITMFGFLFVGYALGALHLAAGTGSALWTRYRGVGGALAGLALAMLLAVLIARLLFGAVAPAQLIVLAGVAALYTSMLRPRSAARPGGAASGTLRVVAGLLVIAVIFLSNWRAENYQSQARDDLSPKLIAALDDFKAQHGAYPDDLEELVPDFLDGVPNPRVGLIAHDDEVFSYAGFGDSYALEFSSVLWVQCAYSPPYDESYGDKDEPEVADPNAPAGIPDVAAEAAGGGDSLAGSWSCDSTPPKLF
jgi:hypothetical protein